MPKQPSDYVRRNVTFAKDNMEEMKLYAWLETIKHGKFAKETKKYWMEKMKESDKK